MDAVLMPSAVSSPSTQTLSARTFEGQAFNDQGFDIGVGFVKRTVNSEVTVPGGAAAPLDFIRV